LLDEKRFEWTATLRGHAVVASLIIPGGGARSRSEICPSQLMSI